MHIKAFIIELDVVNERRKNANSFIILLTVLIYDNLNTSHK